jgi:hypothetical protein
MLLKMPASTSVVTSTPEAAAHFASYVLCDLRTAQTTLTNAQAMPVAMPVCARSAFIPYQLAAYKPSHVDGPSSTRLRCMVTERRTSQQASLGLVLVANHVQVDFDDSSMYVGAESGGTLYYGPGGSYDGEVPFEQGFIDWPQKFTATPAGAGGALSAGTYGYQFIYRDVDARGNVMRSAPSVAVQVTAVLNDSVTLVVPCLTVTLRQQLDTTVNQRRSVRIEVYRTLVGGTTAGPFLYLTSAENDPRAAAVSFLDTIADSAITGAPLIYTGGGALPNVCPPSLRALTMYRSRFVAFGDDGRTAWFTKALVEGEAAAWCDAFTVPPLDEGERVVAAAVLDDRIVAFTRTRVYWNAFDGPGDAGGASDVASWRRLSSDVGCIEPRSVCAFSGGIVFQSADGLRLLTRDLSVVAFGQQVETVLASFPTITSAIVHPTDRLLLIAAVGATYGVRLVYDIAIDAWFVDDIYATTESQGLRYLSQATVDNTVYAVDPSGYAYSEGTDYLDTDNVSATRWIALRVESANVKLADFQGYQRCWLTQLFAARYTPHDLTVSIATDYSDTFQQSKLFGDAVSSLWPRYQPRVDIVRQLCQSVRVKLEDATPTGGGAVGTGRGASWASIAFEVGVQKGVYRVQATQRG